MKMAGIKRRYKFFLFFVLIVVAVGNSLFDVLEINFDLC